MTKALNVFNLKLLLLRFKYKITIKKQPEFNFYSIGNY